MRYLLHPESEQDLREAAEYYKERAGTALSQALFTEFEHSIQLLLQHPLLGALWLHGKRRLRPAMAQQCRYAVSFFVGELMVLIYHGILFLGRNRRP